MSLYLDPVEHSLASKGLRFANYIVDGIVMLLIIFIVMLFLELTGNSIVYFFDENPLLDRLLTATMYFLLMSLQEIIFKGRSIGKFITGTMVVMEDGQEPTTTEYFKRNICRLIPFDAFSFLGNLGWHDSISKTRVVSKKEFEQNRLKFNSIDQIGKPETVNPF